MDRPDPQRLGSADAGTVHHHRLSGEGRGKLVWPQQRGEPVGCH